MFRKLLIINILTLAAITAGAAETYTLQTGEFSRLKVVKGLNVDYVCNPDSAGLAVFTTTADMASTLTFANKDGELKVDFNREARARAGLPNVRVYSSYLTSVENSGDSMVRVLKVLPCPNFSATQIGNGRLVVRDITATRVRAKLATGNGQVIVTGKCDEAVFNMTGTGVIQADGLEAKTVKCSCVGTGSIGTYPTVSLTVHGLGSTHVYYRGTPEVRNKALGVKVEPLP